jgi:hypothetical protein
MMRRAEARTAVAAGANNAQDINFFSIANKKSGAGGPFLSVVKAASLLALLYNFLLFQSLLLITLGTGAASSTTNSPMVDISITY